MTWTQQIQKRGQSLWLDNITRGLLTSRTLDRYIRDLTLTGLTSNPTIFENWDSPPLVDTQKGE
jgi:transaldolase